ncbi:hypothetical protein [Cellulomonas xylanilytica]|uniref:DUF2510 domain-containing protein n=1 Tax=Cellulomonas xylanilytica TaxID=233583 RepID=A0A510V669_9CELL|nr:hypothetical protein [Cellulomonas xylanilytica]GEK21431.1 hypothetical protein CXY01_19510 [Cellulomonas xylanilytica]
MGLIRKAAAASVVVNTNQSRKHNKRAAAELQAQTELMRQQTAIQAHQLAIFAAAQHAAQARAMAEIAEAQRAADIEAGAAWHPDPWGQARLRWHNSREWTHLLSD